MKFVDQVQIKVLSGKGGRGCLSFRREAFVPKGGPDGGDGGNGGDVMILSDPSLNTLLDCQYQQYYRASNGRHGMGANRHGRSAPHLVIRVPVGTLVKDADSNALIADLDLPESKVLVAKGGRGGRGNARFASPRNRAPRKFEDGFPGEERSILLELKLIADVGLVGLPNSGKSTLLSRVSNARPLVADYPFTTKRPVLGVVRVGNELDFVMADIPGLIENAHKGAGMGDRFLRHIERTQVLFHLIDPSPELTPEPEERFSIVMNELVSYSPSMLQKPMIVLITKMDLPENREPAKKLRTSLENAGLSVYEVSAVSGEGVGELLAQSAKMLQEIRRTQ